MNIMLFYTHCARGLAKTNLGYTYKEQKFIRLGGDPTAPSKYAHAIKSLRFLL